MKRIISFLLLLMVDMVSFAQKEINYNLIVHNPLNYYTEDEYMRKITKCMKGTVWRLKIHHSEKEGNTAVLTVESADGKDLVKKAWEGVTVYHVETDSGLDSYIVTRPDYRLAIVLQDKEEDGSRVWFLQNCEVKTSR